MTFHVGLPRPQVEESDAVEVPGSSLASAWCSFDSVDSANPINYGFNVASVTELSTGVHQVAFTNAMDNSDYLVFVQGMDDRAILGNINGPRAGVPNNKSTTSVDIIVSNGSNARVESKEIYVLIIGGKD